MRRIAVGALLVLTVFAGTSGAAGSWRTTSDPSAGFSIGVPGPWQVVPRSTMELNALVVRLRREKKAALAFQFAEIAAVRRSTHTIFRFQAFAWPAPKGSVVPDVTVKIDRLSAGTTKAALPYLARRITKALAGASGATASAPVARRLPAGAAMTITGSTRVTKTIRSRFSLTLLMHGRMLYSLTFRGPVTPFETRIANSFRFVP